MSVREKLRALLSFWLARLEPPLKPAVRRELQLSENARKRISQELAAFERELKATERALKQ